MTKSGAEVGLRQEVITRKSHQFDRNSSWKVASSLTSYIMLLRSIMSWLCECEI